MYNYDFMDQARLFVPMSRPICRLGRLAVAFACLGLVGMSMAEELSIQSFNGSGQLVFNTMHSATNYRVEWASSPTGPWTNFISEALARLDNIPAVDSGSVTCSVPVFYRVVASVTNGVLTLDAVGGLAFGAVGVGTTATRTLTLRNRGNAALTVTGIDYPNGFSGDWAGIIPAGYEQDVTVNFTPLDDAIYGGTLIVHSNAADGSGLLAVSGSGGSDYLVIDVSGGPTAASYPVSYLAAVPGGGWSDTYKITKIVLRRILAGFYMMGSPESELGRQSNEPQHQVTLTHGFYIGVFEVTQRQWELVMGNNPSYFTNATYYASRPVECVSYFDIRENPANSDDPAVDWPSNTAVNAASFMGKLRAKTGLTTFDLPTESQWEYACRAGTTTALNSGKNLTSIYSDANMAAVGRYWYNGGLGYTQNGTTNLGTAKVGTYLPNAWGLYDMHGNAWEWCLDWYDTYPGTVSDPAGAASGWGPVFRGGSWYDDARGCRSAGFRGNGTSNYLTFNVGFRAAMTLP